MRKIILSILILLLTTVWAWAEEGPAIIDELAQKTEGGTAAAMLQLGNSYYWGKGEQRNEAEGMRWYLKAAELGNAEAAYLAGQGYTYGQGVKKSSAEAFKYYLMAAENGHVGGQAAVGRLYHYGIGIKRDYDEAYKWLSKSLENGTERHNMVAERLVSDYYVNGKIRDDLNVDLIFEKAENGDPQAQLQGAIFLLIGYPGVMPNLDKATEWYLNARTQGVIDKDFTAMMAKAYVGSERDEEAARWFQYAVDDGVDMGEFCMDVARSFWWNGDAVEKEAGLKWYKKAAEYDLNGEQYWYLAFVYEYERDYEEALKWYLKAFEAGEKKASISIAEIYHFHYFDKDGRLQPDYGQAFEWYNQAVKDNWHVHKAKYGLALLYDGGYGVEKEEARALKLMYEAAGNNNDARMWLARMYYGGLGQPKNYVIAWIMANRVCEYCNDNLGKARSLIKKIELQMGADELEQAKSIYAADKVARNMRYQAGKLK